MINVHKNKHLLIKMCLHPLAELLSEGSEHPSLILLLLRSVGNSRKLRGVCGGEILVS